MYKTVLIVLCSLVKIYGFVTDNKSYQSGTSILMAVSNETKCTSLFSCLDCNTARICKPDGKGGFEQVTAIPCPAATPYCAGKSGTCGQIPDDSCGTADATFVCLDDGYFPDSNCTNYHVCTGYSAYKYHCAVEGEYYHAEQKKCVVNAPCGTYKCTAAGVKVPHTMYPEYFGYCSLPNAPPTVIDRCKGSYEMNVTSQLCEPVCHKEGVQQDVNDCTKYYKCHREIFPSDHGTWVSIMLKDHLVCPQDTAFAPEQFMCIDIKETGCKPAVS
uniref:Putative chitin binding peritrophin-a domain protein n=1 Tax=Panstrongylus lignarius TaxID=156445 RepID=A0A224XHT2_9HEMI